MMFALAASAAPVRSDPEFEGELLALSDTDMPATGYADGKLEPIAGARDMLSRVSGGQVRARAEASNSVAAWPQVSLVTPDGRYAYVVETKGPAPAGATQLAAPQFPQGQWLQAYDLEGGAVTPLERIIVGSNPQSVSLSPDGRWLVVVTEPQRAKFFRLQDGRPQPVADLAIPADVRASDVEPLTRPMAWSPTGDVLAANVANHRIQFFRLKRGPDGVPLALERLGDAVEAGRRLTLVRWTRDGRHVLTTDTNGGSGGLRALFQPPGRVVAIAFDPRRGHRVASAVATGGAVESFALSDDERWLVAVNIEKTYLPELWFLSLWPGRSRYSLSLLTFDPVAGRLTLQGRKLHAEGLLPEDAVFDASGRHLAVAASLTTTRCELTQANLVCRRKGRSPSSRGEPTTWSACPPFPGAVRSQCPPRRCAAALERPSGAYEADPGGRDVP
jgi:hypothetical protein